MSITGSFKLGTSGCSDVFSSSTPSGDSKSVGGTTMGLYVGSLAEGGLSSN